MKRTFWPMSIDCVVEGLMVGARSWALTDTRSLPWVSYEGERTLHGDAVPLQTKAFTVYAPFGSAPGLSVNVALEDVVGWLSVTGAPPLDTTQVMT